MCFYRGIHSSIHAPLAIYGLCMSGVQEGFISCNKRVGLAASLRGTYYLVLVQKPIDLTLDSGGDLSVDGDANSVSQDRVSMAGMNSKWSA